MQVELVSTERMERAEFLAWAEMAGLPEAHVEAAVWLAPAEP
jgi:hypothetical protein